MSEDEQRTYSVVRNGEEQYSVWPADREVPQGWQVAGLSGSKAECLTYIEEHWNDMRPLSLRGQ
ncbi:MbtH family protein [Streptomyces cremeus]|uniref:MbtH family protein n=1 Tax=Streptomyces cremeus TaxID=66881 RepID=A0ABV5PKT6_STRCM